RSRRDHLRQSPHRGSGTHPGRHRAGRARGGAEAAAAARAGLTGLRRRARSAPRHRAGRRPGAARRSRRRRRQGTRGLPDQRRAEAPSGRPRGSTARTGAAGVSETAERLGAEVGFGLDEVLAATCGELVHLGGRLRFPGITTDTRAIRPGELFVAIRGETHDGHRFLTEAARRGAGAVLSERTEAEEPLPCTVAAVRDTLAALGDLAAFHRRRRRTRVLAVAGSNGKTTTKEMAAAILRHALGT